MFVSIIFCKESINGEAIVMLMTKNWIIDSFLVWQIPLRSQTNLQKVKIPAKILLHFTITKTMT